MKALGSLCLMFVIIHHSFQKDCEIELRYAESLFNIPATLASTGLYNKMYLSCVAHRNYQVDWDKTKQIIQYWDSEITNKYFLYEIGSDKYKILNKQIGAGNVACVCSLVGDTASMTSDPIKKQLYFVDDSKDNCGTSKCSQSILLHMCAKGDNCNVYKDQTQCHITKDQCATHHEAKNSEPSVACSQTSSKFLSECEARSEGKVAYLVENVTQFTLDYHNCLGENPFAPYWAGDYYLMTGTKYDINFKDNWVANPQVFLEVYCYAQGSHRRNLTRHDKRHWSLEETANTIIYVICRAARAAAGSEIWYTYFYVYKEESQLPCRLRAPPQEEFEEGYKWTDLLQSTHGLLLIMGWELGICTMLLALTLGVLHYRTREQLNAMRNRRR